MNTYSEVYIPGATARPATSQVETRDTFYGYVIESDTPAARNARWTELAALWVGFALVAASVAHWLMPGGNNVVEMLSMKVAMSVVFLVIGGVMIWYARRGLGYELQVDRNKRELRAVLRNSNNLSRVIQTVSFDDVGSAFMERARTPYGPARLYVRIRDSQTLIEVAVGAEADLSALHGRLSHDLSAPRVVASPGTMPERTTSTVRRRQQMTRNKGLFRAVR